MLLSTISRQGTEDTLPGTTRMVWRQMSLPMTLEDSGDMVVHSFGGTRRGTFSELVDNEKDGIREEDGRGGVYNVNAEKLV